MRKSRIPIMIAWVFCVVVIVLSILDLVQQFRAESYTGRPALVAFTIVEGLLAIMFAIPAALIISHQPRNLIGWVMMTPVLVAVSVVWVNRYLATFQTPPPPTLPNILLVLYSGGSWVWVIFPLLLLPLLFPTGRPPSRRWNWVVYLALGMIGVFYFLAGFSKIVQGDGTSWSVINPIGFISVSVWDVVMPFWGMLLVTLTIASLASVIARYRSGTGVEREQIKWLLFGFVLFTVTYIPSTFLNSDTNYVMSDIGNFLFITSIAIIPAAITLAILRYKLYDIDVIIRLTLVYAVVTALLALVYIGGIVALQAGFRAITGQSSDVAVLVTTLAITALFNPVRRRVQEVIDRRFYRQKYDAVQALAEFATAARGGSDIDALTAMLVETVAKTLQPTQVELYMKPSAGKEEGGMRDAIRVVEA